MEDLGRKAQQHPGLHCSPWQRNGKSYSAYLLSLGFLKPELLSLIADCKLPLNYLKSGWLRRRQPGSIMFHSLPLNNQRTLTCRSQAEGAGLAVSKISKLNGFEPKNTEREKQLKTAIYKETLLC